MRILIGFCVVALLTDSLAADEPVFSGPQAGEKLTPFRVQGVFGPSAGKEVELIGELKGAPTVLVFVHEITRPTLQLLRPIDRYGRKLAGDGLQTHFVWLTADRARTEQFLTTASKSLALESPVSMSVDGLEGPGNYGLNRKVTLTILVARDNKVIANFAIVQPNETDGPKVLAPVAKLMGKPAPTLNELKVGSEDRPEPTPNAELGLLMRRMIQPSADAETVQKIAREMQQWAGEDAKKKAELVEFCKRILKLGYGNDHAKRALKKLAGE